MTKPNLADRFLALFRPKPLVIPEGVTERPELSPADYESRREIYPILPLSDWDAVRLQQMLGENSTGNFTESELFYCAVRGEALAASALDMRRQSVQELGFKLQCPKDAPDEVHLFTEALAKDWQMILPDDVRGEVIERTNFFGFMVCRVQWVWSNGMRQPRLIPYTHSSLSWRQDLWCFQGQSERGIEYINSDGREWVVFSLGGPRPWLRGLLRAIAFLYFGVTTGSDAWLSFNGKFSQPRIKRIVPRLMREGAEIQRLYARESRQIGGDMVLCPQDENGRGYDIDYVEVNAQGYKTMADLLEWFDDRIAILVLGHNLLQSVKGGSFAATKAALQLFRIKQVADAKILMSGFEPVSKTWARANFGSDPDDFPELNGQLVESLSWSLVYDLSDPEAKQAAAVRSAQYAQGFATFAKAAGEKLGELPIDWEEAAQRCGIPLQTGEDSYSQDDDDDAELSAEEWIDPPAYVKAAARRSLEWVHKLRRGGGEVGRAMARKIVRGHLSRVDVLSIASYWAKHEHDKGSSNWGNLQRPSNSRISWGLWGDAGDGRGRKWSEVTAAEIRGRLTAEEAGTINKRLALPGAQLALPAAAAPTARIGKIGRSQRTKDLIGIVSVACFDVQGRLLMGRRADNQRWTTAGGHLEPGEAPADGAKRELWEEAGISAHLVYLGSGSTASGYLIHCFRADNVATTPTSQGDPDGEVAEWRWINLPPAAPWTPQSLPEEIRQNLHAPRNVLLALLGLGSADSLSLVRPTLVRPA